MQKISPFLWFDSSAEQAANFYVSLFSNSRVTHVSRYGATAPGEPGAVMSVSFTLDGLEFQALNGGPRYAFTEAISMFIRADTQAEVDRLWDGLTADGGTPGNCGWLVDRFGVSWQVVPAALGEVLGGSDPAGAGRAMQAMLSMQKLDIAALRAAYAGTGL